MLQSYDQIRAELAKFKVPSIDSVEGKLREISTAALVCAKIAKVYPNDYTKRLQPLTKNVHWFLPATLQDEDSTVSSIISHLIHDHLFPLDEFWLDDAEMDYRADVTIHPQLYPYRITYDEFTEMVSTDPRELSDYAGFPFMACMLSGWVEEEFDHFWHIYNQRFHWGIAAAPELPGHECYLSIRVFKKELKKRRILPLYTLFMAVDGSIGNIFFDFDYELEMPPTITLSNLYELHKEWKRSRLLAKECDVALNLITTDPQAYVKFLDAYKASLRKRKER
jgi:hypothetical protein